jgi:DMSO/TMAO reductase YedYZ molybdopterin-dependent catalytic subunit
MRASVDPDHSDGHGRRNRASDSPTNTGWQQRRAGRDADERHHVDWIEGIDPRLEVLSAAPLVLQTPVELLAGQRITDKQFLFVRNCQDLDDALTLEPAPLDGWEIDLVGLIRPGRVVIRAEELLGMDHVEHEMVLQCSGNGRSQFAGIPGTPWGLGGVGNVRFAGVPLKAVLERYHVDVDPQVKFVTAEGQDLPAGQEKPDFEHSLPVADVLERTIIALTLNGEHLPAVHGGPVRLVTPGLFGTMQVKWLTRLRFETAESSSFYHATEYRVPITVLEPGSRFRFTMDNSRPTWNLRLMSYILDPQPQAIVRSGDVTVSGVAYNDGSARLEAVLVSFDRGESWKRAELNIPDSPYAWYRWTAQARLEHGDHEIWSRAIDALGRSQPLDGSICWNPNGYEWNGVYKTRVTVA